MARRKRLRIDSGEEWTWEKIRRVTQECEKIAQDELDLDYYHIQLEVITSNQMIDAYTSTGLPVGYYHWSFGKRFNQIDNNYKKGLMPLAYEIVINSDPCIVYCMEGNTMGMQALVTAHAGYGHNAFFKGNYLFKEWTDAGTVIDSMLEMQQYIYGCEERHGEAVVEELLDACHALSSYGVYSYKRPPSLTEKEKKRRQEQHYDDEQARIDLVFDATVPQSEAFKEKMRRREGKEKRFPSEPQENILRFIAKYSPLLEDWQRGIIRRLCDMWQYFYPQEQTQVLNEGFACFTHYYIMHRLWEKKILTDGAWLEFISSHTAVTGQLGFDQRGFSGINPYALGFRLYMDVKRMCEEPTPEDKVWFPHVAGGDWLTEIKKLAFGFRDEGGILQYLSPKVMRDMKLWSYRDDVRKKHIEVTGIHNEQGYRTVRAVIAEQYHRNFRIPQIFVNNVRMTSDRILVLKHELYNKRPVAAKDTVEVLKYAKQLWGFPVWLETEVRGKKKIIKSESVYR